MAVYVKFLTTISAIWGVFLYSGISSEQTKNELEDIIVVVFSQPNSYHVKQAGILNEHLNGQDEDGNLTILYAHKEWPNKGAWTVLPIVKDLVEKYGDTKKWAIFCEEGTRFELAGLLKVLDQYASNQNIYIGKGLRDREATIIHHFAFHENPKSFAYPDFAAGTVFSLKLLKSLSEQLEISPQKMDFSIDVKHELALYLMKNLDGVILTESDSFCFGKSQKECVTSFEDFFPECGAPISDDRLFVAVKTCEKFHSDRIPIVLKTWGKEAKHIEYYSNVSDKDIPTIDLGVPNTERGHCGKMMAILNRVITEPHIKDKEWLIIVDDDTIISIPRLKRFLSCYDPKEAVAIGERYGYGVTTRGGYEYITGGGGMVLSLTTVRQLIDSNTCHCGTIESPDDMTLGLCLSRQSIPITHSPLFHQARPNDYSEGYLSHQKPISFHKHWMIDGIQVYKQWFETDDFHDEL